MSKHIQIAEKMKSKAVKQVSGWVLPGVAALIIIKDVLLGWKICS